MRNGASFQTPEYKTKLSPDQYKVYQLYREIRDGLDTSEPTSDAAKKAADFVDEPLAPGCRVFAQQNEVDALNCERNFVGISANDVIPTVSGGPSAQNTRKC